MILSILLATPDAPVQNVANDLVDVATSAQSPTLVRVLACVLLASAVTVAAYQLVKRGIEGTGIVLPWWVHRFVSGAAAVVAAAAAIHASGGDILDPSMWIALVAAPMAWAGHKTTRRKDNDE